MTLEIGMRVECRIEGHDPGVADTTSVMYVIGEPIYSENGSHVVLADEKAIGMPVSAEWCKVIACGCADAEWMRARFEKAHPCWLKPRTDTSPAIGTAPK